MKKLLIVALLFASGQMYSQAGFDFKAVVGLTLAQLDGDMLAGYNKPGISVGGRLSYALQDEMDISLEMLYSSRGSQEQLFGSDINTTNLQYIELPIIFSYKDWLIEGEDYHKVRIEAGLSYGILFDFESENTLYRDIGEEIRDSDLSYVLGAGYQFTKRIGMSLRYTRGLIDLYRPEDASLISYFLTLRAEYTF